MLRSKKVYDGIVANFDHTRVLDKNLAYIAMGSFGNYYLSLIKGNSTLVPFSIRGIKAVQETVDLMRKNGSIVNTVNSFNNYYFYRWLMTSGEYVWTTEDGGWFRPNSENISIEKIREIHKGLKFAPDKRVLGRTPSSWGSSMETLRKIFTSPFIGTKIVNNGTSAVINFDKKVRGEDADFIFIEFSGVDKNYENVFINGNAKNVVQRDDLTWFSENLVKRDYNRETLVDVTWFDDERKPHSFVCSMGRGKLLIPLGSGCNWLLNYHDNIVIGVRYREKVLTVPNIVNVKLLKVQEVK